MYNLQDFRCPTLAGEGRQQGFGGIALLFLVGGAIFLALA
jgi:hypothetical protein